MTGTSTIRWTDLSWNPVTGCSRVSPGCENCYAETLSLRHGWSAKPWSAQNAAENVVLHPERLHAPLAWQRRAARTGGRPRVFVNSMSDLFHEQVPDSFIDDVFAVMQRCPLVTFQVLTKRPVRMCGYALHRWIERDAAGDDGNRELPNVWLGTSIEDQRRADERIPILLSTPARVRFLSCEPLLGPVRLAPYLDGVTARCNRCAGEPWDYECGCSCHDEVGIGWVIAGGESGPGFRPMHPDWARDIRDDCQLYGVPFFFKQSAAYRTETGQVLDGERWEQFPERLGVHV